MLQDFQSRRDIVELQRQDEFENGPVVHSLLANAEP